MQNVNGKSTPRDVAARAAQSNLKLRFSMPCFLAALFALVCNPSPAGAQLASCQTPAPPFKIPSFTDANIGFPLNSTTMANPHNQFVTGDLDGDGNDELITILNGEVRIWRWLSSGGWTSAGKISSGDIAALFPDNFYPLGVNVSTIGDAASTYTTVYGPMSVRLADVDGDGQKEIVIYVAHGDDTLLYSITSGKLSLEIHSHDDLELIYKYDRASSTFKLLTSDPASYTIGSGLSATSYGLGPSSWVKAHKTDTRYTRVRLNSYTGTIDAAQFVNGAWTAVPAAPRPSDLNPGACVHTGGDCAAFSDVNGDGNTDMIYLANDGKTHILPSTSQTLFGGAAITSKIPAAPAAGTPSQVAIATTLGWMMGDIDGDGKDELLVPSAPALTAYYWDATANDFVAVADPGASLADALKDGLNLGSMTISPTLIQLPNNGLGAARGVVGIAGKATIMLPFANQGGKTIFGIPATYGGYQLLDNTISLTAGSGGTYGLFFRLPLEGNSAVVLTRSASGLINHVATPRPYETGNFFVEPSTVPEVSDRGYPVYTASQQLAYQYISTATLGRPDIRSLYPDPAVPWAHFQYKLETLAAPPASAGISAADFAFVQKQIDDELTALQSTNAFFDVTGQILTNMYLVKDAALSETAGLLGLSSQPDVTGQVLNIVTTALNGLGSVLSAASSIVQIAGTAADAANIANKLAAAGSVSYLLGSITGDISTYTTGSAPDLATGSYDLKKALDDDSFAATTSNTCHQSAALADWSQSKYISDGILSGDLPLDLATQQAFTVAGQALFRLNVWQALASTKWSTVTVQKFSTSCTNCLFAGDSNYPLGDSVQVTASCALLNNNAGSGAAVSVLLEDPSTSNYPNLTALNALFNAPPNGLGARPADVLLGHYNWNIPYQGIDVKFSSNTKYTTYNCSNWQPLSPQVTPNVRAGNVPDTFDPARLFRSGDLSADTRIERLIEDVKSKIIDAKSRDVFFIILDAANSRLRQARTHNQRPTETLRLLNDFIDRSQRHATVSFRDSATSRFESIEAVAIRDSLAGGDTALK